LCANAAWFIICGMFTLIVIIVLLLSTLWGFLRGALRDVLGLAALMVAYIVSEPFGRTIGEWLAGRYRLSAGGAYVLARVGAGLAIYVSLKVSAAVANRRFGEDETGVTRHWNRNLGAALGLLYGLVLVLIVVFMADSLHKAGMQGGFVDMVSNSWIDRSLSPYNPADKFLLTDTLALLRKARQDPAVLERLHQDPAIRALMDRPDVRAVLDDRDLAEAIRNGDLPRVLQNENLKKLLEDKELMRRLLSPEVRKAIRDAVQKSREEDQGAMQA
jgi:uncharacterized membrane protein required for colicin V production